MHSVWNFLVGSPLTTARWVSIEGDWLRMKLQVVIYLMYLLIITGFPCFFSPPYLFSKWTNILLQGNYKQEFFGCPDMAFSCKQTRNSNRFEISYRVSCQGRLIPCYLFFQRLNWYFFNCFNVFVTSYVSWRDFDIQCYEECVFFMFPNPCTCWWNVVFSI